MATESAAFAALGIRSGPDAQDPLKGRGRGGAGDALRGAGAPRLAAADIAKAGASPYQSSMPMNQTAASSLPGLTQAAQAISGALSSPYKGCKGSQA